MSLVNIPIIINDSRRIIHVDMDAFYASVEEREHPKYKSKALVIAHDPRKNNNHGVVTTANYNARQYGVHSAMPAVKALELIPKEELVFTTPNFELYQAVSAQIHDIFSEVTDISQSVALDEAYLDVTNNKLQERDTLKLVHYLQSKIYKETNLTCSIGVSYNKFLAKMASDYAKPFGRTLVLPEFVEEFLNNIPIEKFNGIGKNMQKKLHDINVYYGSDLRKLSQDYMITNFGKWGYIMYQRVRGIDDSPVEFSRVRKSIGKEKTYNRPLVLEKKIDHEISKLSKQVFQIANSKNLKAKTVVIKIRTRDFNTFSKRKTFSNYLQSELEIYQTAKDLYQELNVTEELRLVGVTVTNLDEFGYEEIPLNLFEV